MDVSSFFLGPYKTPQSLKRVLWALGLIGLIAPIFTFFLNHSFSLMGPSQWFALSRAGIFHGWVWQPFTYFIIQTAGVGISLSFLLSLAFHLFLLWFSGSELINRFGTRPFFLFFFGGALLSGLFAASLLLLFSSQAIIVGLSPPLFAVLTVWAMLYPDLELFFFFLLRIKAKRLIALFFGIALLFALSSGHFVLFFTEFFGMSWGYLIGRTIWKLPNPFSIPHKKKQKTNKIIDISVMHESDEAFMERMLDKVAAKGEGSLTSRERERMNRISSRKK